MELRKATRQKAKLRIGLSGPSGSGKTYSALLIAKGIASSMDKVALIDTENGSGDLYTQIGDYNVLPLQAPYSPERYIEAIETCIKAGMEVVVIDSATHEWDGKGGALEINDLIAKTKYKGNSWSAWSETTPRHQRFIEAITTASVHIITTARAKTDTVMTDDKKVKKLGMKEIQREGFEYELTANFTLDRDGHYATASKDRTGLFIHRDPFRITQEIGAELKEWAESGVEPILPPDPRIITNKKKVVQLLGMLKIALPESKEAMQAFIPQRIKDLTQLELKDDNLEEVVSRLEVLVKERNEVKQPEPEAPTEPVEPTQLTTPEQEA